MNYPTHKTRTGFTLVEILVVIVIATVVLSIAIPRIRTVTKERNARETARAVGSAFANAGQRALIDGSAGVRLIRNQNFNQGGLEFAVTQVSLLRAVPAFTGDQVDAEITASSAGTDSVDIDEPFEQTSLDIVQAGDSISFSSSSIRYRITNVDGIGSGTLTLTLDRGRGEYLPIPAFVAGGDNPSYVIHRLPRLLRSSQTDLPNGHIIDLRLSGFEVLDGGDPNAAPPVSPQLTTVLEPSLNFAGGLVVTNYTIDVIFRDDSSVDRVIYRDPATGNVVATRVPLGTMYFYIDEAPDSVELTEQVATASETGLWVACSSTSGSTNIGYNNSAPSAGQDYQSMTILYNNDRAAFNTIISNSRDNTTSASASQ